MKGEDPEIEYDEGYNENDPVHNPAKYMWALHEVSKDIEKARIEAMRKRLADKPGEFAGQGCIFWILIIALCLFVGYLFTL